MMTLLTSEPYIISDWFMYLVSTAMFFIVMNGVERLSSA